VSEGGGPAVSSTITRDKGKVRGTDRSCETGDTVACRGPHPSTKPLSPATHGAAPRRKRRRNVEADS